MSSQQLRLEFNPVHVRENNAISQAFIELHRFKFNGKCKTVLDRLVEGEYMTVLHAANTGISSLPRRIKDLRDFGVVISQRKLENGTAEYYMSASDKEQTLKNLLRKIQPVQPNLF
jgi:hypothetical protein